MYGIGGEKFRRQYKKSLSEFKGWEQKSHAEDWIIFPQNCLHSLSLDEVALSDGELPYLPPSRQKEEREAL